MTNKKTDRPNRYPEKAKRDKEICERYSESPNVTAQFLADEYGLGLRRVQNILHNHGVRRKKQYNPRNI